MSPADPSVDLLTELVRELRGELQDLKREAREINAQCKITNGRVTNLELDRVAREAVRVDRKERTERGWVIRLALLGAVISGPTSVLLAHLLS
jgi:hypothetical protein